MNIGRLIITIIVAAVFFCLFDMLYHGGLLKGRYEATADSWRTEEESWARFPQMITYYFMIAIGFCTVWAFGFGQHGIKCGAIYGFFLGLMGTGGMLMSTIFSPIPDGFTLPWAIGGLLSGILGGVVTALVYKPKSSAAAPTE